MAVCCTPTVTESCPNSLDIVRLLEAQGAWERVLASRVSLGPLKQTSAGSVTLPYFVQTGTFGLWYTDDKRADVGDMLEHSSFGATQQYSIFEVKNNHRNCRGQVKGNTFQLVKPVNATLWDRQKLFGANAGEQWEQIVSPVEASYVYVTSREGQIDELNIPRNAYVFSLGGHYHDVVPERTVIQVATDYWQVEELRDLGRVDRLPIAICRRTHGPPASVVGKCLLVWREGETIYEITFDGGDQVVTEC